MNLTEIERKFLVCGDFKSLAVSSTRISQGYIGRHTWEVDEFWGENEGLVMAEIELESEDDTFDKPAFIGREVTGDRRYYNSHMRKYPYKLWDKD